MQVKYKSTDGQFEVTFDAKDSTELFQDIASFQEVFETGGDIYIRVAGVQDPIFVPKEHVQFRVRKVEDNHFYEKVYSGPNPKLWGFKQVFGKQKEKNGGSLFPKRFLDDEDKANYEDGGNGWRRWKKDKTDTTENISTGKGQVPF